MEKNIYSLYKPGFVMDRYRWKSGLFGQFLVKISHIWLEENLLAPIGDDKRSQTCKRNDMTSTLVYPLYFLKKTPNSSWSLLHLWNTEMHNRLPLVPVLNKLSPGQTINVCLCLGISVIIENIFLVSPSALPVLCEIYHTLRLIHIPIKCADSRSAKRCLPIFN
jgi:hypothetical protein